MKNGHTEESKKERKEKEKKGKNKGAKKSEGRARDMVWEAPPIKKDNRGKRKE